MQWGLGLGIIGLLLGNAAGTYFHMIVYAIALGRTNWEHEIARTKARLASSGGHSPQSETTQSLTTTPTASDEEEDEDEEGHTGRGDKDRVDRRHRSAMELELVPHTFDHDIVAASKGMNSHAPTTTPVGLWQWFAGLWSSSPQGYAIVRTDSSRSTFTIEDEDEEEREEVRV